MGGVIIFQLIKIGEFFFLWFVMTRGVTALGKSIFTAAPAIHCRSYKLRFSIYHAEKKQKKLFPTKLYYKYFVSKALFDNKNLYLATVE